MARAPVFTEIYRSYLQQLEGVDLARRAGPLGVTFADGGLAIPVYGKVHHLSATAITGPDGRAVNPAIRVILARYVLDCPEQPPVGADPLMSYREFADAAPLLSYFTTNTNKTIETHFSGGLEHLRNRARTLGAVELTSGTHDLSLRYFAVPRVPVLLNFNDQDDLFGAACSVLYRQSAKYYLDMECLAMTGTLLAGWLISGD
ncbi:DUF3786 domain-containing protein [Desulfofustis glycolicus]|uniref:DUF3786 domain-containing protein n=1 Tax=Desulfofustis glycolicus DSM 9705 TaxID=1121409 RepID=A0A1M5TQD5_9BACT|nr:DUF3786 domain-containing protein [Desulfofustis glycolicus]MCB2216535.1 DUF3786 domain-containing protein [Desulfobulbaceae bacterium]SHH52806.1 protein of unknown function [Desulfofustis glycolicus DSM 9705]